MQRPSRSWSQLRPRPLRLQQLPVVLQQLEPLACRAWWGPWALPRLDRRCCPAPLLLQQLLLLPQLPAAPQSLRRGSWWQTGLQRLRRCVLAGGMGGCVRGGGGEVGRIGT